MTFARLGFVLLAGALLGACNSSGEPQKTYNLCVHAQDAPFEPGSTGTACAVTQQLRAGQIRTVDLEADMYSGEERTATLAIEFAPNGWTVTLGGTTIPVPGQQTLTMTAPSGALPGNYQIAVRATSGGEQVILTFNITLTSPI
jgi:hypothetical protein